MAAKAVVGALRVNLAMSAADFRKGAQDAGSALNSFARKVGLTGQNIKRGLLAIGAAAGAMAAAMGVAVNRTLGEVDKLAKLSRSIGVPVEEMSKLRHAAELSGVSIEELGRAFRNVARNAQGAARAPTDFSRSLDALNVQWREANGQFRRADALMLDVADKFSQMEDGAGKTALAMKIFGEEMGPRMVSLLNSGSEGIRQMTEEAAKLGLTVNTSAAKAAENFNDQWSRLTAVFSGLSNQLTQAVLPVITRLIDQFVAWSQKGDGVRGMAQGIASAFTGIVTEAIRANAKINAAWMQMRAFAFNLKDLVTGNWDEISRRNATVAARVAKEWRDATYEVGQYQKALAGAGWAASIEGGDAGGRGLGQAPTVAGPEKDNAALQLVNETERERLAIMQAMQSPYEQMIAQQARLNEVFAGGATNADAFARASQMAAFAMQNAYGNAASAVSGALSSLFQESKGLAIANALINTYEAVTAALKNPPGPPFSYAYAAAALAQGMAQVSAIRSTNKSGSGGGNRGSATPAAAQGPAQIPQTLTVRGLQPGQLLTSESVRDLATMLLDYQRDGGQVVLQ